MPSGARKYGAMHAASCPAPGQAASDDRPQKLWGCVRSAQTHVYRPCEAAESRCSALRIDAKFESGRVHRNTPLPEKLHALVRMVYRHWRSPRPRLPSGCYFVAPAFSSA